MKKERYNENWIGFVFLFKKVIRTKRSRKSYKEGNTVRGDCQKKLT